MRAIHLPLSVLLAAAPGCARTSADRPLEHADDADDADDVIDDVDDDDDDDDNNETAGADGVAEAERRDALPPAPGAEPQADITGVFIDDALAAACAIPRDPEPYFEYDSAAAEPEDNPLLRRLADCLVTGPLSGRKVELRGYTGPSGATELVDGDTSMARAESVRSFLLVQGVAPEGITVRPGGETGAMPDGPSDWPHERRVDIVLLPSE